MKLKKTAGRRTWPGKGVPPLFEKCPACGAKIKWAFVGVDYGGDPAAYAPLESFHFVDCKCGYEYTRHGGNQRERERGRSDRQVAERRRKRRKHRELMSTIKAEYIKGSPLPASIGLCADLFAEVRELRLAMQKVVDDIKERENEVKEYIIQNLSKSDDTGAAGKRYRAQIVVKPQPQLKDWSVFTAFVAQFGRWDLLYKRAAEKPVKDMWEAGEAVPGVDKFMATDVSITKI